MGRKLTQAAIELAQAEGVKSIDLTSRPKRVVANGLYKSMGFVRRETNVYRYSA
ncbi:MAG: hypothetical protein U9Q71_10615 [Pseudomonadota bacterium]|nr:hypothetical protein [Pseudomonadota bacterium]